MCWCWRSLLQCPHGFPCAMGLELGTAGVQQCPQCAALAARARGTWLGGSWGLTVSPSSSCSAAGRGTWSCVDFGELCTCQGSSRPTFGREGPAWVPPCPSPEHSHHRQSPGMSQCSSLCSQGWAEPPPAGAAGPWQSWGRAGFEQVLSHVSIVSVPIHGLHPCPCMRVTCCPAAPWL